MLLITIDVGANDPEDYGSKPSLAQVASCLGTGIPSALANLGTILARLRAAAGPGARIVGMNYYLPELAEWRDGPAGQAIARLAERLAAGYKDLLDNVYGESGVQVANVFSAFDTTDSTSQVTIPGAGTLPRNVAFICQWTWECARPPRGPNQRANQAGYHVIARTILQAAGLS